MLQVLSYLDKDYHKNPEKMVKSSPDFNFMKIKRTAPR